MDKIENISLSKGLYIVSTPIGNLKDITIRALITLKNCDFLICEDTRITKKLLSFYKIKAKLISHHDHTPEEKLKKLIEKIKKGKSIALVSDAGTPLLSDPGYKLVVLALKENLSIIPIPGPSAITTSLVASGLSCEKFFFAGFLPAKENKRINFLKDLINIKSSLIFFESPRRLNNTLKNMLSVFGNRKCVVSRELTKFYETFYRGELKKISIQNFKTDIKGEITIIVDKINNEIEDKSFALENEKLEKIFSFAKGKVSTKHLASLLSIIYKKPRSFFYSQAIKFIK